MHLKILSDTLQYIHLDGTYSLLTARNAKLVFEWFKLLDCHNTGSLNDIQFFHFLNAITNLGKVKIYKVFDMLDVDGSGDIDYDEFYLIICILIAIKDNQEKQFIYRHSRTVFELLDEDGSNSVSAEEFKNFGFLFNFHSRAVATIFDEFDISGDQELDYKEFKMFTMACIDRQMDIEKDKKKKHVQKLVSDRLREKKKLEEEFQKHRNKLMFVTAFLSTKNQSAHRLVRTNSRKISV
ncbi:PREDICTED: EF-hand calcium-binding domain-containing protein 9-like [Priapulus caudatus]|uniref:EF-hand calcium-binding domain-containing protein 9-like n=1 Tax=Priapulus caudatus TaxID=37621 RepID=A0ABM1DRI4_PRICU|nr:PREDICTED: EF-hand calcium-binding domain-containing protein 9-like [Priapulus caudatus]